MLEYIPYSRLTKNERAYEIMLLRDQHGNTFTEIAKAYGLSTTRAAQIYSQAKFTQIRLYINHIAFVLGHENTSQIKKVFDAAHDCYWDWTYACGHLEKAYKSILDDYRGEEPGMPAQFIRQMPPFKPATSKRTIARVIEMREVEKASFIAIGEKLRITRDKAGRIYDSYYHQKALALVSILAEKAEGRQAKMAISDYYHKQYPHAKKRYDAILQDHPDLPAAKKKG